jgi:hypothetical protein
MPPITATNQSLLLTLESARDGNYMGLLEEKFRELNRETQRFGRPGTLTIKITATPDDENIVEYTIDDTVKLPKAKPTKLTMYVDKRTGAAQVTNPTGKQGEIEILETRAPVPQPLKAV